MQIFQSTLPTRGSDGKWFESADTIKISIHAPHEGERRALGITTIEEGKQFQSTLPTRGSDVLPLMLLVVDITFQSTLPTRGSDLLERKKRKWKRDFNPRSPRGGATAANRILGHITNHFNPRSPRGGATLQRLWSGRLKINFNPRSPRGGATMPAFHNFLDAVISIHAPHEGERRFIDGHWIHTIFDFNPRSPRGGATSSATVKQSRGIFQSTLPTRGSDELMLRLSLNIREFQSTLPTRGSDLIQLVWDYHSDISIHAPHEGERRYNCIYA